MNKYASIIALVVFAALAAPMIRANDIDDELDSQAGLAPTNEEEVAQLDDSQKIFYDFCKATRDHVIGDMKSTTYGTVSDVFGLFFKTAEKIGLDSLKVESETAEQASKDLNNPSAPVADIPKTFYGAFTSVLSATKNNIAENVKGRLVNLRQRLGLNTVVQALQDACTKVSNYERDIREQFEETKKQLVETDPSLANVKVEDVKCVTSRRVFQIEGLCNFAQVAQNPLMKMFTGRSSS